MRAKPEIFHFLSHVEFLNAWLEHKRGLDPGYSFTAFAEASGLSRSALPNVLSGARLPSSVTLDGIARALELDPTERNYLGALVDLARAPSIEARRAVIARLTERDAFRQTTHLPEDMSDRRFVKYGARWYLPAVLELARMSSFRPDAAWVADALFPPVSVEEAQDALDTLLELGLLREDGGTLRHGVLRVETAEQTTAAASEAFHMEAVPAVLKHVRLIPLPERQMLGGVMLIPMHLFSEAREILAKTWNQLGNLSDDQTDARCRAYQLAMHLVPVSRELD